MCFTLLKQRERECVCVCVLRKTYELYAWLKKRDAFHPHIVIASKGIIN